MRQLGRMCLIAISVVANVCALAMGGCATALRGDTELVRFESEPSGAQVTVTPGGFTFRTPAGLELHRDRTYVAVFELEGFESRTVEIERFYTGADAGNILIGGLVGFAVDARNGAAYSFRPNPVRVPFLDPFDSPDPNATVLVTFTNTSSRALYSDGSGPITIKVDGRLLGTIDIGEELGVRLEPGDHRLYLDHRDIWLFDDEYPVSFGDEDIRIEVYNRPMSTRFRLTSTQNP